MTENFSRCKEDGALKLSKADRPSAAVSSGIGNGPWIMMQEF